MVVHKFNLERTYTEFIDPAQITCSGSGNVVFHLCASPLRGEHSVVEAPLPERHTKTTDVHYFGASASGNSKLLSKHSVTPHHPPSHYSACLVNLLGFAVCPNCQHPLLSGGEGCFPVVSNTGFFFFFFFLIKPFAVQLIIVKPKHSQNSHSNKLCQRRTLIHQQAPRLVVTLCWVWVHCFFIIPHIDVFKRPIPPWCHCIADLLKSKSTSTVGESDCAVAFVLLWICCFHTWPIQTSHLCAYCRLFRVFQKKKNGEMGS